MEINKYINCSISNLLYVVALLESKPREMDIVLDALQVIKYNKSSSLKIYKIGENIEVSKLSIIFRNKKLF